MVPKSSLSKSILHYTSTLLVTKFGQPMSECPSRGDRNSVLRLATRLSIEHTCELSAFKSTARACQTVRESRTSSLRCAAPRRHQEKGHPRSQADCEHEQLLRTSYVGDSCTRAWTSAFPGLLSLLVLPCVESKKTQGAQKQTRTSACKLIVRSLYACAMSELGPERCQSCLTSSRVSLW